ncbi:uracil-DNA glycosylase family protein [Sulfitobacter sp. S190]|uniref:uracil-DNA glycosylase n=1 Tax=Sulfitobacter sp. S190 TaxID=2867022 RepID=UPI0021A4AB46|nr:uracil-DNA glycosylase [Sulfitobacter sp. S190]UWR23077.1 uracil-DNA glycosylase [Sulfitobacter sp. S190]
MESTDFHTAKALLDWQIELGADECMSDAPINRYELPDKLAKPKKAAAEKPHLTRGPVDEQKIDPVAVASQAAASAATLEELRAAMQAFDLCSLKKGARNMVFSDGMAGAPVMIIGEAPGREEDRIGKPFVGAAGQLLDRMFAAIDMGREHAEAPIYITNTLPWRPPQNRDPKPEEIAMMKPFLLRHIELADPKAVVIMGNWACQALLGKRGITRLRGIWTTAVDKPALPMCHPAYLLRNPAAKKEAWADLLSLRAAITA